LNKIGARRQQKAPALARGGFGDASMIRKSVKRFSGKIMLNQ
jgi:hypothetical protein